MLKYILKNLSYTINLYKYKQNKIEKKKKQKQWLAKMYEC